MEIIVVDKPISGRRDRVCRNCGDNYFGWNMYVCHDCETDQDYSIVEAWLND